MNRGGKVPPPEASHVDPERLTALLQQSGWQLIGGRRGHYNRLTPPEGVGGIGWLRRSLIVPLDRAADDFGDVMAEALTDLSELDTRDQWLDIAPRLAVETLDAFRFKKESAAPAGLISWKQGEDLISSARATLVAGAKAHLDHTRRFGNRFGQFASRYLDQVLMGQTEAGSYIVTAFSPTRAMIPVSASKLPDEEGLPGIHAIPAREVTSSVAQALDATSEALHHYRSTGSFGGFEAGVRQGVSYDLARALYQVTKDSDGGEIAIEWDPSDRPESAAVRTVFEFRGSDAEVLQTAANRLGIGDEETSFVTIEGRVHLLTKHERGDPGVFGLELLRPPVRKFRVRLHDAEQYHTAVRAHDEDLAIRVFGRIEREGNMTWLYDARIEGIIGGIAESEDGLGSGKYQDPDQIGFDF